MKTFRYTITDPLGIHARPAGLLVKKVAAFQSKAAIQKGDKEVDARRLMSLMGLGVKAGDEIVMTFDGPDEQEALEAVEAFVRETL